MLKHDDKYNSFNSKLTIITIDCFCLETMDSRGCLFVCIP